MLEKVSDTEWSVQIGILKMKVKESNMEYINTPKQTEKKAVATVKGRDYHVSLELDLRGERFENAMARVEILRRCPACKLSSCINHSR